MSGPLYENDEVTDRESVATYLRRIAKRVETGNQLPFGPDDEPALTPGEPLSFSIRTRRVDRDDVDVNLSVSVSWAAPDSTSQSESDSTGESGGERDRGGTKRGANVNRGDDESGDLGTEQADLPPPSAGTRNEEKASHEFERATYFMGKGKTAAADARFQHAIKADPASAKIRRQYANFLWRHGQPQRARAQFEHALEIAPERAKLRVDVANFHWNRGNQDAAAEQFETAIDLEPDDPDVHSTYGRFLWEELEEVDSAVEHLKRALEIDDEHALAHVNFATLLRHGGRLDHAEDHYESAIEHGEDNPTVHNEYGHFLWAQGDVEEAARHYAKARKLDPTAGE